MDKIPMNNPITTHPRSEAEENLHRQLKFLIDEYFRSNKINGNTESCFYAEIFEVEKQMYNIQIVMTKL